MRLLPALILCLLFSTELWSQHLISGSIRDAQTGKPLAFVNLIANGNKQLGTSTDIDGNFALRSSEPIAQIRFTYVGYTSKTVQVPAGQTTLNVALEPQSEELDAVTILPGENPAHRIIRNAVANRKQNNPQNLDGFRYKSYNKMIHTVSDMKTFGKRWSSSFEKDERDSVKQALKERFAQQHMFILESVSERKKQGSFNDKETVLSTRVSGLPNPSFAALATDVQPFAFYDTYVSLLSRDFLNPISPGSTGRYNFTLRDTLYQDQDSVFIISFSPPKAAQFDGLRGVLYITTDQWAIRNVIAEPASPGNLNTLRIQQLYSKADGEHWFPEQLNFDFEFHKYGMVMIGRSYLSERQVNPEFQKREFDHLALAVKSDAGQQSPDFWSKYRPDSLSTKELTTYKVVDSLGQKLGWDKFMQLAEAAVKDEIPFGVIALQPSRLLRINAYEGWRLGLGLKTSEKLTKIADIGGYAAYGTKDKEWKYGAALRFHPEGRQEFTAEASYSYDVLEPGRSRFLKSRYLNNTDFLRNFLIQQMNTVERTRFGMGFRTLRFLEVGAFAEQDRIRINNDYRYALEGSDVDLLLSRYNLAKAGVQFRFAYKERLSETFGSRISLGTKYPVFWMTAIRGFDNVADGQFAYDQVSARLWYDLRLRHLGQIRLVADAGMTSGEVPYTELAFGNGSYRDVTLQFVIDNTFQTMRLYEFLASNYVRIYYRHQLATVHIPGFDKSEPKFVLSHNALFGELEQSNRHRGIDFTVPTQGFHETGLIIEDLVRLYYVKAMYMELGGGLFYRHGAYAFDDVQDNIAWKIAIDFDF